MMHWEAPIALLLLLLVGGLGMLLWRVYRLGAERRRLRHLTEKLLKSQENERQKIAEELHDSVGQNLLVIKGRAQLGLATAADSNAAQQLAEIAKVCSSTIEQTRQIARNLGPRYLAQLGLSEALDAMIEKVANATSIQFERRLEDVDGLYDLEAATKMYRIVQEALNNVIKHARPSRVRVELIRDVREVRLTIADNGRGFELSAAKNDRNGGIGLSELEERVRMLGGRLDLQSQIGKGTTVTVTVPIADGRVT